MASLLGCGESSDTAAIADSDNASTLTLFYTDKFDRLDPAQAASAAFQQTISLYADSDPALITCHVVISEPSSGAVIYSLDTTVFQRNGSPSTTATKE